jgi:hypothetical protein
VLDELVGDAQAFHADAAEALLSRQIEHALRKPPARTFSSTVRTLPVAESHAGQEIPVQGLDEAAVDDGWRLSVSRRRLCGIHGRLHGEPMAKMARSAPSRRISVLPISRSTGVFVQRDAQPPAAGVSHRMRACRTPTAVLSMC